MSERKQVIATSGIESSEAFGRIGIITESNFQTWKWRTFILAFLLNVTFVVVSTLFDHFMSWGAAIGISVGILGFFPSFYMGMKVITKRTIRIEKY